MSGTICRLRVTLLAALIVLTGALPAAAMPRIQQITSPGGMTAWLVEEPAIPLVAMRAWFPGGAASDPDDRIALSLLATSLLDEGAGDLDSLAFQTRLEDLSIRLSFQSDQDGIDVRLSTLAEHKAEAFDLLGLALAEPRFDDAAVERVRQQIAVAQVRRLDDPNTVASETWSALAFPGHPYGRSEYGTPETLAAITRADLKAFAAERLRRGGLLIAIVGDVDATEAGTLLDAAFGALPASDGPPPPPPIAAAAGLHVVERAFPQSVVQFGLPGIGREDPDWYAATILNHILGGGSFTARLTREIRVERGLAYSVDTALVPWPGRPLLVGFLATENASVAQSLDLVRKGVAEMAKDGVSAEELSDAQTYLTGSFPLSLDSNAGIAAVLLQMRRFNLPPEHLEARTALIESVTREDVARVAARMLDPDRLLTVVVGQPEGVAGAIVSPPAGSTNEEAPVPEGR